MEILMLLLIALLLIALLATNDAPPQLPTPTIVINPPQVPEPQSGGCGALLLLITLVGLLFLLVGGGQI